MPLSTAGLTLAPDTAIDLQLHTVYSDGAWTPEALVDHLISAGFALAAITDHDRVDTAEALQALALQRGFPLVVAAEFTTDWRGEMTDVLCFGFDPQYTPLQALCANLLQRQQENTRMAFAHLQSTGVSLPSSALDSLLAMPSARQPQELLTLVHRTGTPDALQRVIDAGSDFARTPIADVVETAHRSGAVVLIAHPGRGDMYVPFTIERLDQLRAEVPIDGFEVYYPLHTPEQVATFHAYAEQHDLLVSAGSDSHAPEKRLPIHYPASHARRLLERLGITVR